MRSTVLLKSPWLVFDTETTGYLARQEARPVEIAAVYVEPEEGQIVGTFQSLMKAPIFDWAGPALAVNGIKPEEVEAAPAPAEVLAAFGQWALSVGLGATTPGCTAYNVPFDSAMIRRAWNVDLPWGPCLMTWSGRVMRREDAEVMRGKRGSPKLGVAAEYFGVAAEGTAHRALADALVAAKIMVELAKRRA